MIKIKTKKGITLVSLIMTIIILSILSTVAITTIKSSNNVAPYNKMIADITLLEDKILVYYNKYGEIPIIENTQTNIEGIIYNQIDTSKLEGITLNFGLGSELDDYYLLNNNLEVYYLKGIEKNGVLEHKLQDREINIDIDTSEDEEELNEYGFYFNKEYICKEYNPQREKDYSIIVFYEDGSTKSIVYGEEGWNEGISLSPTDINGTPYTKVPNLIYDEEFTGTGMYNETYTGIVDNNGNLTTYIEFPTGTLRYSEDGVSMGGMLVGIFSNNGRTLNYGGKTYILEDDIR